MKIITWNVRAGNKKLHKLIHYTLEHRPDVICLQEVPQNALPLLLRIPSYTISSTCDLASRKKGRDRLTCILTRSSPSKVQTIRYGSPRKRASFWDRFVYQSLNHIKECHTALVVELQSSDKIIHIISTRLTGVIGTRDHIRQIDSIFRSLDSNVINIFCGDFNIVDNIIVNVATGWARGYKLIDYVTNERKLFERLCQRYNFINIFKGISTWVIPKIQFDHILVPKGITVHHYTVSKKRFGSDHRMLFADVGI